MATLTKKDLLEAIEDMPMDAEIGVDVNPRVSTIENFYIKPVENVYIKNGRLIVLEINKSKKKWIR